MNKYKDGGVPKEKLLVGMSSYGRCFSLSNANVNGLGAPASGPCPAGKYTREAGILAYYEVLPHRGVLLLLLFLFNVIIITSNNIFRCFYFSI